ncbi:MAG: MarR family transcriptional regulator [Flavobacteriales bacterium]|nr:MarR family transcriptional regulator [Flavobacteriales bacterium]
MKIEEAIQQGKFKSPYQKLVINIAFTNSYLSNMIATVLKPYDLSMQQYNVLRILRGQHPHPVSINSITERMIDRMSNASRLVEKLRKKELVERRQCAEDKRQVDVILTDSGLQVLHELDDIISGVDGSMNHLTEKEANQLNDLLDKLRK